jgi:DNA-binding NarL/FixJ family response regulator
MSGRPVLAVECRGPFWAVIRAGGAVERAGVAAGVSESTARRWFRERGGVMPAVRMYERVRGLRFTEREEIAVLRAQGLGVRAIARVLGRSPSTVSRELRRVTHHWAPTDRHRPA